MPMPDKMGLSFTPTEITDLTNAFNSILTIMNSKKIVQLTGKERQKAQSASEKRLPYIDNAINNLAPAFPNLQPPFMVLADATKDIAAANQLRALNAARSEVNDRMIDFSLASEHFAYEYMRKFYAIAKEGQSVNTPGADTVVEALAPLFEGQGVAGSDTPKP